MASVVLAQSLEVIDLKYRTASELIPILQPLVREGGALSGQDYKLFVRASRENLAEIRRAIDQLDRAPRQYLISVRTGLREDVADAGVSAAGTISTSGARARVGAHDVATQNDSQRVASVAVLEGNSALINTGTSVPIVTAVAAGVGRHRWAAMQTEYRDLSSGYVVTPRVNDGQVVLEISQRAETLQNGTIRTQELQTQASGKLGQWIALGAIRESATSTRNDVGARHYATQSDERGVWIKVERM